MMTSVTRTIIGCCLAASMVLGGCGGREVEDDSIRARNLATGEIQTFSSAEEVPSGWVTCPDPECSIPTDVPCDELGDDLCTLQPSCRLKELWCAEQESYPPQVKCEYACIPKLPLLCEELNAEDECAARSDCEWMIPPCPMYECPIDAPCPPMPPCPDTGTCVTKAPPVCQVLDEQECLGRADCDWIQGPCPGMPCTPEGVCPPCPFSCQPTGPQPPPCPMPSPPTDDFCQEGTVVSEVDENGCVVGWTCIPGPGSNCADLNAAYIAAVKAAKACDPYSPAMVPQCSEAVDNQLICPLCVTFVNALNTQAIDELNQIKATFQAQGCHLQEIACPAIACQEPASATCLSTSSGGGQCVDDPV